MYEALLGKPPTPEHLQRFRLECRRGDWGRLKEKIIKTNKSVSFHYINWKTGATPVSPVKLNLFGTYLDSQAKTCPLESLYSKINLYVLGIYFNPVLVQKADTPWYFKRHWKMAFIKLAEQWPNITSIDDLPASRLGLMLLCR